MFLLNPLPTDRRVTELLDRNWGFGAISQTRERLHRGHAIVCVQRNDKVEISRGAKVSVGDYSKPTNHDIDDARRVQGPEHG
jgi:hypothetical protein